jgi:transposase
MPQISRQIKELIIKMHRQGKSQRFIAQNFEISRGAVRGIVKKFLKYGTIENMKKSGRPNKTSIREQKKLCNISISNPFYSASQLHKNWHPSSNVSLSTVKRILRKYKLFGRVAAQKPLLTKRHINARFLWCKTYQHWCMADWRKVIFSDECRIELFPSTRRMVRRPVKARYRKEFTSNTKHCGGSGLMLYGAIKSSGQRCLVRCQKSVNSQEYIQVLQTGLLPMYNINDYLIQDSAPCHTSKTTQDFLEKKGVCVISDFPPVSPDINIIENMWSLLKNRVACHSVKTLNELWAVCENEWQDIPNDTVQKLYDSIPSRIQAILKSKGHSTKY